MAKKKNPNARDIEPGMVVEATRGDLGEEDVSKPKVTDVVEDQNGDVKKLIVEKGVVFRKKLEIPAFLRPSNRAKRLTMPFDVRKIIQNIKHTMLA